MISLSLLLILINFIIIIVVIFANVFRSRVIASSLIIIDLVLIIVKAFDYFVFANQIEDFFINLVLSLNLTGVEKNPNFAIFIAGLIVILQMFVLWLMIYALIRRFVPYKPPILLSKHEERTSLNEAVIWKTLLVISLNIACIYVLVVINYVMGLEYGFLEVLFKFGFGVR